MGTRAKKSRPAQSQGNGGTVLAILESAKLVIDTNVVLDMLVFDDERGANLLNSVQAGQCVWLATAAMREECARVLDYPQISKRRAYYGKSVAWVLQQYDALCQFQPVAAPAPFRCKDKDDQIYIDLACALQAQLLSKDRHILSMRKRLGRVGVVVRSGWS